MEALPSIHLYNPKFPNENLPVAPFTDIPMDVVLMIFRHLSVFELIQLKRSCRFFRRLTQHASTKLSQLDLLIKMKPKTIPFTPVAEGFTVHDNHIIFNEKNDWYCEDFKLKKRTLLASARKSYKHFVWGELSEYSYFMHFENFFKLIFIPTKNPEADPVIYNLSVLIGDADFKYKKQNYFLEKGSFCVLQVGTYLLCFKENILIVKMKTAQVKSVDVSGDFLVVLCREEIEPKISIESATDETTEDIEVKIVYSQFLYHIPTQTLLTSHVHSSEEDQFFNRTMLTDRYIVNVSGLRLEDFCLTFEVFDWNFNRIRMIPCNEDPDFLGEDDDHPYGPNILFHCYQDRLVVFINNRRLLFFNLTTGELLKNYDLESVEDEILPLKDHDRVFCNEDLVVAGRKNSLCLFEIHTGKRAKRFSTTEAPLWVEMHHDTKSGYKVTYTVRNRETEELRYERLESRPGHKSKKPRIKS